MRIMKIIIVNVSLLLLVVVLTTNITNICAYVVRKGYPEYCNTDYCVCLLQGTIDDFSSEDCPNIDNGGLSTTAFVDEDGLYWCFEGYGYFPATNRKNNIKSLDIKTQDTWDIVWSIDDMTELEFCHTIIKELSTNEDTTNSSSISSGIESLLLSHHQQAFVWVGLLFSMPPLCGSHCFSCP